MGNPQWMYHKCPASCGVCEQSICADSNTTQCHIWHDSGECERNPMAVMKDCPATCGVCSTVCTDHDEGCKGWAAAGQCTAEGEEELEDELKDELSRRRSISMVAEVLPPSSTSV